jgi:hypothetical protein
MANRLQEPEAYAEQMAQFRARNPGTRAVLTLERKTNRHPETDGRPWGWYELFPLRISVGEWGNHGDDLRGVDLSDWNRRAKALTETK